MLSSSCKTTGEKYKKLSYFGQALYHLIHLDLISSIEEFELRHRPNPQCGVRTVNLKRREPATIQSDIKTK